MSTDLVPQQSQHALQPLQNSVVPMPPPNAPVGTSIDVMVEKQVAEMRARFQLAVMQPRDYFEVARRMKQACDRPTFAKVAEYHLPVGGRSIPGPSIRLAEELARCMGHISHGVRRMGEGEDASGPYSSWQAFCFDLQSNMSVEKEFRVYHWREVKDKRTGGKVKQFISDPLEINRLVNSFASRHLRECILRVVPGDLVEDALELCRATVAKGDNHVPLAERISACVHGFAPFGVTREDLERKAGCSTDVWTNEILTKMRGVFVSIKTGEMTKEEAFDIEPATAKSNSSAADVAAKLRGDKS